MSYNSKYTGQEIENILAQVANKVNQDNIKTVNGESILGSGDINTHNQYENVEIAELIGDILINRETNTVTQEEYNKFVAICPNGKVAFAHIPPNHDLISDVQFDIGMKGLLFKIYNQDGDFQIYANTNYGFYNGHYAFIITIDSNLTVSKSTSYGYITPDISDNGEKRLTIAEFVVNMYDHEDMQEGFAFLLSGGDGTKFLSNSGEYKTIEGAYIVDWFNINSTDAQTATEEQWNELKAAVESKRPIYYYYDSSVLKQIIPLTVVTFTSNSIFLYCFGTPIDATSSLQRAYVTIMKGSNSIDITCTLAAYPNEAPKDGNVYGRKNGSWVKNVNSLPMSKITPSDSGDIVFENKVDQLFYKLITEPTPSKENLPVSFILEVYDYVAANINGQFSGMDAYNYNSGFSANMYGANPMVSACIGEGDGTFLMISTSDLFGYQYFMKGDGMLQISITEDKTDYDIYGCITYKATDIIYAEATNPVANAINYYRWNTANNIWREIGSKDVSNTYVCTFLDNETITESQFNELSAAIKAEKTIVARIYYDYENSIYQYFTATLAMHYGPDAIMLRFSNTDLNVKHFNNFVVGISKDGDSYTVETIDTTFSFQNSGNGTQFLSDDGNYKHPVYYLPTAFNQLGNTATQADIIAAFETEENVIAFIKEMTDIIHKGIPIVLKGTGDTRYIDFNVATSINGDNDDSFQFLSLSYLDGTQLRFIHIGRMNTGLFSTYKESYDLKDAYNKLNTIHTQNSEILTTLKGLHSAPDTVHVELSEDTSISVISTSNGKTITAYVYSDGAYTITIPTSGDYVSMCGSSYVTKPGTWVEFNLTCVSGKWHISKLEQE